MSLEKAIENLTAALDRHTKALLAGATETTVEADKPTVKAEQAKPSAPKEQPKPQPKPEVKPEVKPQPTPVPTQEPQEPQELQQAQPDPQPAAKAEQVIDRAELKRRTLRMAQEGKAAQMVALMKQKFGVGHFDKLSDSELPTWAVELDKLEG